MSCRLDSRRSAAPPERNVRARVTPASPLEPDVERPRRIESDDTRPTSIAADPCGEALLDGDA